MTTGDELSTRADLQRRIDFFRALQQCTLDTGEAYPGERETLQIHINCLWRVLSLRDGDPADTAR